MELESVNINSFVFDGSGRQASFKGNSKKMCQFVFDSSEPPKRKMKKFLCGDMTSVVCDFKKLHISENYVPHIKS